MSIPQRWILVLPQKKSDRRKGLLPRIKYSGCALLLLFLFSFSEYVHLVQYIFMDPSQHTNVAYQEFSGGIIVTSYAMSTIGAMTALELLTRRTHIKGLYNWSAQ